MKTLLVALLLVLSVKGFGQKTFDFSPLCQQAYTEIMKLRTEPGRLLVAQARQQNPNNLIPELLEGYIDFFELFFNEDPAHYATRKPALEARIIAFDAGNQSDPFYRYCKSLAYMQRAAIRIKFGERYAAGWDFKRANTLMKDNRTRFPRFQPNNMVYGPLKVIIGTVPSGYKWITSLFGMSGSVSEGMQHMRSFLNSNDPLAKLFSSEAIFYYCYLAYYVENKPEDVFRFIQTKKLDLVNNHLFAYMAANLALNNKRTAWAESILQNKSSDSGYMATPVWDMEMGYIKLHQLKLDDATKHLESFIRDFKGRFYVKDILLKLAWAYYLKGNMEEAEKYRILCIKKGSVDADADKQAYRDAKSGKWPHQSLLKSRLLNDGGYVREALAQLTSMDTATINTPEERLEYIYRLGRTNDDLGHDDEALRYYQRTIDIGKNRPEYYAARAALQMGYIFEKRGQKEKAIAAFQQCIDMEDHEYNDSLDQRAKSGIARLKGE